MNLNNLGSNFGFQSAPTSCDAPTSPAEIILYNNDYNSGSEPPTNWTQIGTYGTGTFTIDSNRGKLTKTSSPGFWVHDLSGSYDDYLFETDQLTSGRMNYIVRCSNYSNYIWVCESGYNWRYVVVTSGVVRINTTFPKGCREYIPIPGTVGVEVTGTSPNIKIQMYVDGNDWGSVSGIDATNTNVDAGKFGYNFEVALGYVDNTKVYRR